MPQQCLWYRRNRYNKRTKLGKFFATKGGRQIGKTTRGERGVAVTVLCAMNAAGVFLPPMFIYPRKRMIDSLINGAPPQSVGYRIPKRWTDSSLFVKWLDHIVKFTNCSKDSRQIINLDGYHSHNSLEAARYTREKGVHFVILQPHCTYKMQLLDWSYFKSLKSAYNANAWMVSNPARMKWAQQFCKYFLRTAMPEKAFAQLWSMWSLAFRRKHLQWRILLCSRCNRGGAAQGETCDNWATFGYLVSSLGGTGE